MKKAITSLDQGEFRHWHLVSNEFHNDDMTKYFTEKDKICFAICVFLTPVDVNAIQDSEIINFVQIEKLIKFKWC